MDDIKIKMIQLDEYDLKFLKKNYVSVLEYFKKLDYDIYNGIPKGSCPISEKVEPALFDHELNDNIKYMNKSIFYSGRYFYIISLLLLAFIKDRKELEVKKRRFNDKFYKDDINYINLKVVEVLNNAYLGKDSSINNHIYLTHWLNNYYKNYNDSYTVSKDINFENIDKKTQILFDTSYHRHYGFKIFDNGKIIVPSLNESLLPFNEWNIDLSKKTLKLLIRVYFNNTYLSYSYNNKQISEIWNYCLEKGVTDELKDKVNFFEFSFDTKLSYKENIGLFKKEYYI